MATDRVVGFDELGATDDFPTSAVEKRLLKAGECSMPAVLHGTSSDQLLHAGTKRGLPPLPDAGVVAPPKRSEDDDSEDKLAEHMRNSVRRSQAARGDSDEDSDFD